MSGTIGAGLPPNVPSQAERASDPRTAQARASSTAAISDAKKALAKADAAVEADRQAHSPSCEAYDQKKADKATADLAQAKTKAEAAAQSSGSFPIYA